MASDRQASAAGLSALMCLLVALAACSPVGTRDPIVVTIWAVESADARAPLQFSVRAEPAPATDLTVSVTIAADGCDLTQSLESVTIVAAEDQAVFTVLTTSLEAGAGGECTVAAAIAPGEGYQVGAAASASAPVTPVTPGHQPRVVTIAAGDSPVTEGETARWTLSATPAPTTELTVNLNWTQSGSFLPGTRQQTVTIPVSGEATVSVDTVDDSTDEPNGSVTLSVADGSGYAVGTPSTAAVTVTDNDNDNDDDNDGPALPVVTIRASGATSIVEGATASWTLSATPAPTTELTVNLNWTQSGSFLPGTRQQTVTIPVSGEATVSVDTVDDSTDEPNGSVTLSVADGSGYAVGTPSTAAVTVTDNDNDNDDDNDGPALPVVTIRASGATSIVEGATASWTLSATPAPTTELTVNLNWTQSGSFLPETRPQTVTIPVSGAATVSVDTVDDSTDEPNGTVTLSVVGGSGYSVGTSNTATVTVSDNDAGSRVATLHVTQTQVTEGENITFQIKATRAFDNNGTITVSINDSGLGFVFTIDHVLFAGQTSRDLFRTVPDLAGNQADRTVRLSILVHTGYTVGSPGSATIMVIDSGN